MKPCPINYHIWPNVCQCQGADRQPCQVHNPDLLRCLACGMTLSEASQAHMAQGVSPFVLTPNYTWGRSVIDMLRGQEGDNTPPAEMEVGLEDQSAFSNEAASNMIGPGINYNTIENIHRWISDVDRQIQRDDAARHLASLSYRELLASSPLMYVNGYSQADIEVLFEEMRDRPLDAAVRSEALWDNEGCILERTDPTRPHVVLGRILYDLLARHHGTSSTAEVV